MKIAFIFVLVLFSSSFAEPSIPDEDWGYINIEKTYNSNMFWWLYGAQSPQRQSLPFVMWLQGGPGASSLFGNFVEIGPKDIQGNVRNSSWVPFANLLFLDNPIGTGWSFTNDPKGYSTTDESISHNLVVFLENFVKKYPQISTNDFWIFSESYGGKMAANAAVAIHNSIQSGRLNLKKFKGVGLGDSWVAPVVCMKSYGQFLETQGLVDGLTRNYLDALAVSAEKAMSSGKGSVATSYWSQQQSLIIQATGGVDFYDYLRYNWSPPSLRDAMNSVIRRKLSAKIQIPSNVQWVGENGAVFNHLVSDFMKPAITSVEILLDNGYTVAVLSGQLDLIVDSICINDWVENLNWSGAQGFFESVSTPYLVNGVPMGAVKKFQNLQLWNVFKASHMLPMEAPLMSRALFSAIVSGK